MPIVGACAWFAGLAVLLHPVFFVIYRMAAFNTVPRDDYAGFLLWTTRTAGGALPGSPYAYRLGSMLLAVPFYAVLPAIRLTTMPEGLTAPYLRATAALSAMAFLAWIAGAMLVYAIAVRQCGLSRRDGLLAGALMWALGWFGQITAIDPLSVAMVALGVAILDRPAWFGAFVLASVAVNEKVALTLAIWLAIRCVLSRADRRALGLQCLAALVAVAAYVALVKLVPMPGNSYQLDLADYPTTLRENLAAYASARGILLDALPIAVIAVIAGFAHFRGGRVGPFRAADLLVIPALAVVALLLTHLFQAGRIVLHAAPLFVVPAVAALGRWLDKTPCRL